MGGDGSGGGSGSGVGSSDRARARCYLETLRTRAAGATARHETRLEDEQAEIEGDRAEIVAISELAAATCARLLDDSPPSARALVCAPLHAARTRHPCCVITPCTPARAPCARRFGSGLLELQELCWETTPAPLLERVVAYERVHAMPGGRA